MVKSRVYPDAISIGVRAEDASQALELLLELFASAPPNEASVLRAKQKCLARLAIEQVQPYTLALQVLPALLFRHADGHGAPWTGTGRERGIAKISCKNVEALGEQWRLQRRLKIAGAGPAPDQELFALMRDKFHGFVKRRDSDEHILQTAPIFSETTQVAIARSSNRRQTAICAGLAVLRPRLMDLEALILANTVLGGMFSSRLNLRLREDKRWTYGIRTQLLQGKQVCLLLAYAEVRTDAAAPAMHQIESMLRELVTERPLSEAELSRAKAVLLAERRIASGDLEKAVERVEARLIHDLSQRSFDDEARQIGCVSRQEVMQAYQAMLSRSRPQWLLVGDADVLFSSLSRNGYSNLHVL